MTQYFPKPYEPFSGDINVKVDLLNYGTKTDIKNISHVDTSNLLQILILQKLLKLKRNLLIIIMASTLLLQSLIL